MEELKKEFYSICDNTVLDLNTYYSEIVNTSSKDTKARTAEHYTFLGKLLNAVKATDDLTSKISAAIIEADRLNDIALTRKLSALFDVCLEHRKNLEDYFSASEAVLKQEDSSLSPALRNRTDNLMRRTMKLKELSQI